jgi:hypothetical protein
VIFKPRLWVGVVLALGAIYAIALSIQSVNEFFDRSSPTVEKTTVVQKFTRYNPFPISVISVRNLEGAEYNVEVSDDLAAKLASGATMNVVRKKGFFGKEWVQDQEFYEYLNGTRTIQGFIYVAMASIIAAFWLFVARKRFKSLLAAMGSLLGAGAIAAGAYWFLL